LPPETAAVIILLKIFLMKTAVRKGGSFFNIIAHLLQESYIASFFRFPSASLPLVIVINTQYIFDETINVFHAMNCRSIFYPLLDA